jgi:hypothetical protein
MGDMERTRLRAEFEQLQREYRNMEATRRVREGGERVQRSRGATPPRKIVGAEVRVTARFPNARARARPAHRPSPTASPHCRPTLTRA